jgi:hypothetical protein
MSYEHQKEANQVSQNVMDVVGILTDDTPDQQQLTALLAESATIFAQVTATLSTEQKKEYKAKFLAAVGLAVTQRALNLLLPDAQS